MRWLEIRKQGLETYIAAGRETKRELGLAVYKAWLQDMYEKQLRIRKLRGGSVIDAGGPQPMT
jgi:hypothetical protein